MFGVAVEFLKGGDGEDAAIGAHELVAMILDPGGDGLVVALAAANERGAEVKVFGLLRGGRGKDLVQEALELRRRERLDGFIGVGMMLNAEAGVEEAEVLGDLGDGGDGALARTAGDTLLDRDGGRDAGKAVDGGAGHLLHELAGVGAHGVHEAALALGEDDVEGEGALARSGDAGDDVELTVRDGERDVFEVVLAGALETQDRSGVAGTGLGVPASGLGGNKITGSVCDGQEGLGKVGRGGGLGARDLLRRSLGDDAPAGGTGLRADFHDPVGGFQDVQVVLDDDQAVAAVDEGLKNHEEAGDVMPVESGGGLIQQEQGAAACRGMTNAR